MNTFISYFGMMTNQRGFIYNTTCSFTLKNHINARGEHLKMKLDVVSYKQDRGNQADLSAFLSCPDVSIPHALKKQFDEAWENGHILFFSAPCGTGKTAMTVSLLKDHAIHVISASDPDTLEKSIPEECEAVVIDDFQYIKNEDEQRIVLTWLRQYPKLHFIFLSRGVLPGWLMSYRLTGLLNVIEQPALALDKDALFQELVKNNISLTSEEFRSLLSDTNGYALGITLLIHRLKYGAAYTKKLYEEAELELFRYFEDAIFRRFEPRIRSLLLALVPFDTFNAELAKFVVADNHVGELLSRLMSETTMFKEESTNSYRFWPIFRRFLEWELITQESTEGQNEIYRRAGHYYELRDEYDHALACYQRCKDHRRVSELLVKNGRQHPGTAHYYEMEQYYYALPREEILRSPDLMSAMSMLTALSLDVDASEEWYQELKDYAKRLKRTDADYAEARDRLIFLNISLPQRGSDDLVEMLAALFKAMKDKDLKIPEFSVTSTLPSIMNGGKDFCSWSRMDDMLYATMKHPIETVLGRDGIALADCAICESKLEKGEDVSGRLLTLMTRLSEIRHKGTPDIEFAAMGLAIRSQSLSGKAGHALDALEELRRDFIERGETRFIPNMDAMRARLYLKLGRVEEAEAWRREKAPSLVPHYRAMYRYQYMSAALVCIAKGAPEDAIPYVALFLPYCKICGREMDALLIHLILAIAYERMKRDIWKEELSEALDTAFEYRFITPISQFGAAILPLLTSCVWEKDKGKKAEEWFTKLLSKTREQTVNYPDYLKPPARLKDSLTPAETQVLRLICFNRSNQEIADILGVKLPTVKTQVSGILQKLGVNRRIQAKDAAVQLGLFDPTDIN